MTEEKDKIKILFFTHYSQMYGANKSLLTLVIGLRNKGIKPIIVLPSKGKFTEILEKENILYFTKSIRWWAYNKNIDKQNRFIIKFKILKRIVRNVLTAIKLRDILKKYDIDLLYTNSAVIPIGFICSLIYRKPHIWHLREYGEVFKGFKWDFGEEFTKYFIGRSNCVIAVSNVVKNYYQVKSQTDSIKVVYNGIVEQEVFDSKHYKRNLTEKISTRFTFAIIGNIQYSKGQHLAVKGFFRLQKYHNNNRLLIVGDGNILPLKNLAKKLGLLDKIDFTGFIDNPCEIYKKTDAILVCSKEAMSRVTSEAMASCLPVIGLDIGSNREIIKHKKNGLLFNGNVEDLANCMKLLIEDDKLRRQISLNGYHDAKILFLVEDYIDNIFNIIQNVR